MRFSLYTIITAVAGAMFSSAAPAAAPEPNQIAARSYWDQKVVKPYPIFDEGWRSLSEVACGKGQYSLANTGWGGQSSGRLGTFGGIPYQGSGRQGWGIGTSPEVGVFGSSNCGKCYKIWYQGRTAYMKAVGWGEQYTIGKDLMNYLTGTNDLRWNGIQASIQSFDCPSYWRPRNRYGGY